jgi:tRNA(fMet)-specific endonuclease VapC
MRLLLDTNAYVRFLAGDEGVLKALGRADKIFLSVFVLGELFAGFRAGGRERENRLILENFLAKPGVTVLGATQETAEYFGLIKAALKNAGRPIPINDVWIAAQTLETASVFVTYDTHFAAVPGLRLWDSLRLPDENA